MQHRRTISEGICVAGTAVGQSINQYVRICLAASDEDIRTRVERICQAITGKL